MCCDCWLLGAGPHTHLHYHVEHEVPDADVDKPATISAMVSNNQIDIYWISLGE